MILKNATFLPDNLPLNRQHNYFSFLELQFFPLNISDLIFFALFFTRHIEDLTHECSCFIEFIKRVEEKRVAKHLSILRKEFNEFNNTGARMLDSIYNMTYLSH